MWVLVAQVRIVGVLASGWCRAIPVREVSSGVLFREWGNDVDFFSLLLYRWSLRRVALIAPKYLRPTVLQQEG